MLFSKLVRVGTIINTRNLVAIFVWIFIVILFTSGWLLPNIDKVNTVNDNQIFFFKAWYFGEALQKHLPILPITYEFYPEGLEPFDEPLFLPHTFTSGLLSLIIPLEIGYNILLLFWLLTFGIAQFFFLKIFSGKKYWFLALALSFLVLTPYTKTMLSEIPNWLPLVFTPILFIIAEKIVKEKKAKYAIILSIFLALYFISNPQYFYYTTIALIIFFAFHLKQIMELIKNNVRVVVFSMLLFFVFSASHLAFIGNVFRLSQNNYSLRIWEVLVELECRFRTEALCSYFYDSYYPYVIFLLLIVPLVGALFLNKNEKRRILPYLVIVTFFAIYSSSVQFSLAINKFLPFSSLLNNPTRSFFVFLSLYPVPLIIIVRNLKGKWLYIAIAFLISLSLYNVIISNSEAQFRFERLDNLDYVKMEPFYFLKDKPKGAIFVEKWPVWEPYLLFGSIVSEKPIVNGYADFKFSRDSHCAEKIDINNISQECQEFYKKHNIKYYLTFQSVENEATIVQEQGFTIIDILKASENQKVE